MQAVAAGRKTGHISQACQVLTALLRDLPSLPELQRCVASKSSAAIVLQLSSTHAAVSAGVSGVPGGLGVPGVSEVPGELGVPKVLEGSLNL